MRLTKFVQVVILLSTISVRAAAPAERTILFSVVDQSKRAVAQVRVQLKNGAQVVSTDTDEGGRAKFSALAPAHYSLSASKDGFEVLQIGDLDLAHEPPGSVELTLIPAAQRDSVEVHAAVAGVEEEASAPETLASAVARQLPSRPATVADALPLIPGVVRKPDGGLQISGAAEHRSALLVNAADVTDPATGQFGLTIPIDSVDTLNVYQTPFLAEFGRFTAGLVSVETRRGGEKWRWELNDPFPEFRVRSWDLRGLRTATPRLNLEGPLIPGKLYFSEAFEFAVRKTEVFTLPFPNNQQKQEGINSFAQLDWIASARQLVTATIHVAPQRLDFVNMNYFDPLPTTPEASTHNYTGTVADHLTLFGGMLDNTLSATRFDASVWGQGTEDLVVTPGGNSGNYYASQNRKASRLGWASVYSLAPITAAGTHSIKAGSYLAGSWDAGRLTAHPINVLDSGNQLLERITFTGGQPYQMSDIEYAIFGQDHWVLSPRISVDVGVRAESQAVSESVRFAPRAGISWNPFSGVGTIIRASIGVFYERVPLNVYAFNGYPSQILTTYNSSGVVSGPVIYQNALEVLPVPPRLVFQEPQAGNFSPRSTNWSIQVEQPFGRRLRLRSGYLQNEARGLVVLNQFAPNGGTETGLNMLTGTGRARYRQLEFTTKVRIGEGGQLFVSYVRSRARGDLNDFNNYLGSFPVSIIRADQTANLSTDLPNRFLAWGVVPLPWKFRIAPTAEYRSGFPYAVTDAAQNYVGVPNRNRFPNFLSVDARVSKDFKVNPKYSVRLSVSGFNLTSHFNPEAFHSNMGDPAYGLFFGHRRRWFTADFDVMF